MPKWKAQQDCRSYRNTGTFTGENPDQYGNQNQWAIYDNGCRIILIEEAGPLRSQEVVNFQARLVETAPLLLSALEDLLKAHEKGYDLPWGTVRLAIARGKGQL